MKGNPSDRLGGLVRGELEGDVDSGAHIRERARFVESALKNGGRRSARMRIGLIAAAVSIAGGAAFVIRELRAPLAYTRGPERQVGSVSEFLAPPDSDELPLYFSDGSIVVLSPRTQARVERTTHDGGVLSVESGRISANIVHRARSEWRFLAGPYSVRVTGTAFVLSWNPRGILDVEMKAGVVEVSGPGVEQGTEVRTHRQFVVPGSAPVSETSEIVLAQPASTASSVPASPPVPSLPASSIRRGERSDGARAEVQEVVPAVPSAAVNGADRVSWSALVANGEYALVVRAAREADTGTGLAQRSADDLAALADAARFSGEGPLANETLRRIRSRFPGTARAESSAFLLGRLADDGGDARTAVGWYQAYLNEAPNGTLAPEALGRRMLALRRLNDSEDAQRAAREYLARFPSGPHANIARDIVGP